MKPNDQEIYATAGLIHDIGKLVVMLAGKKYNVSLLGVTAEKMTLIGHDENKILGLNQSQVGWRICRKWKFSPIFQEAVLRDHRLIIDDDFSFPGGMVYIAHFVSYGDMSRERVFLKYCLPNY
jgi:HD-like signal output (HDOD) protein